MPTKLVPCNDDDWTNLDIAGSTGCVVQMASQGRVRLFMGTDAPSVNDIVGLILGSGLEEAALSNIPLGEDLWIRAIESELEKVTLLYG
jgi:hypothetical protein